MPTAKQRVQFIIEQLPDDCSFEDIQYHVYVASLIERRIAEEDQVMPQDEVERRMEVLTRIQRGCDDIAAGRVISHDEMKRKFLRNKPGDGQK
jgi:hypothetical protein